MQRAFFEREKMELITLSPYFYQKYAGCTEILTKQTRPYACLSVMIDGVRFAIPFRHHISHKWAYMTYGDCGLDYSKAVVVTDDRYIGAILPRIEQMEYNLIKGKETLIANGMRKFLLAYKKAVRYQDNPHYQLIRRCSALQYFHEELHIL